MYLNELQLYSFYFKFNINPEHFFIWNMKIGKNDKIAIDKNMVIIKYRII